MIRKYRKTLIDLFAKVQNIQESPFEKAEECLSIQKKLIQKIIYVEKRTRYLKELTRTTKKQLRNPSQLLDKSTSKKLKEAITQYTESIKAYQALLIIFRCIGDALVFTYLPKWDIKPIAFKQPSGFISGKKGFQLERKGLRFLFQQGYIAILNDITNNLRYGDITVISDGSWGFIEVKSSNNQNKRVRRQIAALEEIVKYLETDETDIFFFSGKRTRIKRKDLPIPEEHHREELNRIIEEALINGSCFREVESGLYYYVDIWGREGPLSQHLQKLDNPPIAFYINRFKPGVPGYYPFTLSIRNHEALFSFYNGELMILVFIDPVTVSKQFLAKGIMAEFIDNDDEWILRIYESNSSKNDIAPQLFISDYFFNRVSGEFLSINWFVQSCIYRLKNEINE